MARAPRKSRPAHFTIPIGTQYTPKDLRFTTKGDVLYAIGLRWPTRWEAVIRSLAQTVGSERVQSVALLGSDTKLQFDQRADGLHAQLPAQAPAKYGYVLRVMFN
jgi:alpha-L-fucosidase